MAEAGGTAGRPPRGDRAVAPVTGKLLEVGVVLLYLAAVSTTLYGGVVPEHRSTAGGAVAERTLAAASQRVQQAVPPNRTGVEATATVALPDTIRGRSYEVGVEGRTLVVDHPHPAVRARAPLALPDSVVSVSGRWRSTAPARVVVTATPRGLAVDLREGRP